MIELIAYHEAGHALVAYLLGGRVRQVTIEPDHDDGPRRGGDTQVIWRRTRADEVEFAKKSVQVHLAGPVAEMIYSGEPYHPAFIAEWAADWQGRRNPPHCSIAKNPSRSSSSKPSPSLFTANCSRMSCGWRSRHSPISF